MSNPNFALPHTEFPQPIVTESSTNIFTPNNSQDDPGVTKNEMSAWAWMFIILAIIVLLALIIILYFFFIKKHTTTTELAPQLIKSKSNPVYATTSRI